MRYAIIALLLTTSVVVADTTEIEMIDATKLSVEELMALANADRENADTHDCCDWGGLGCRPDAQKRQSYPADPAIALMAGVEEPA